MNNLEKGTLNFNLNLLQIQFTVPITLRITYYPLHHYP